MAEGCGRDTEPEFNRFMQIAMGSACETEYQLLLARDLGYITQQEFQEADNLSEETAKLIYLWMKSKNKK